MTVSDWYAFLALIISLIALYQVDKNRVEFLRAEITSCVIESLLIFKKVIVLLKAVSNNVTYIKSQDRQEIETASTRYWREINDLAKQHFIIESKQEILFRKELYDLSKSIVDDLNKARKLVRSQQHDDLKKAVNECQTKVKKFIDNARQFLGSDKIEPLGGGFLIGTDEEK